MALARAASNLAHNLRKGIRETSYMVTAPMRGAKADLYRKAVKMARETKGEPVNPGVGAKPKNYEESRSRGIIVSRSLSKEIKRKLPLK